MKTTQPFVTTVGFCDCKSPIRDVMVPATSLTYLFSERYLVESSPTHPRRQKPHLVSRHPVVPRNGKLPSVAIAHIPQRMFQYTQGNLFFKCPPPSSPSPASSVTKSFSPSSGQRGRSSCSIRFGQTNPSSSRLSPKSVECCDQTPYSCSIGVTSSSGS